MSVKVTEKRVSSTDGKHVLVGKVYVPDGEIKGLFHIVHGMVEHVGRYHDFMMFLAEHGYLCFGYDHLGHGQTAAADKSFGFIASKDGAKFLVDDVWKFAKEVRAEYPVQKYILFGHSMGSFIVRLAAEQHGKEINGLIACGTGSAQAGAAPGKILAKLIAAVKGERHVSKTINRMAFGLYNSKFEGDSPYEWITRDTEIRDSRGKDPFCRFSFTISAMIDLIYLNVNSNRNSWFEAIEKDLPIYLIAGEMDPVGNYGEGVKEVYERLQKAGAREAKLKIYPECRHEILNELNRTEVYQDILNWAEKRTSC